MKTLKKLFSVSAIVALLGTLAPMYAFGATYTAELEDAYEYAHSKGITTMDSIDNANMFGNLTRIAMAKMIANYATTVLGLEPDTSAKCTFSDVTAALDAQYDNGVTKACQLGLMGQNITAFRPNDPVTRGEFGTTLSRALNANSDDLASMNAADPFYKEHLAFLKEKGIMNDISNPSMTEVRGYVMLMMMRADDSYTPGADGCTAEELLACTVADDMDACIAACSQEPENPDEPEEPQGNAEVTISRAGSSTDQTIAKNAVAKKLGSIKLKAGDEDAVVSSLVMSKAGLGSGTITFYLEKNGVIVTNKADMRSNKNTVTVRFTPSITIKAKSTETFDVYANFNAAENSYFTFSVSDVNVANGKSTGTPVELGKVNTTSFAVPTIASGNIVLTNGATQQAGDTNKLLGKVQITPTNVETLIDGFRLTTTDTSSREDLGDLISNVKAYVNGQEKGNVTLNDNSIVVSDLNITRSYSEPVTVELKSDAIFVGASETIRLEILANDIVAYETTNNERIASQATTPSVIATTIQGVNLVGTNLTTASQTVAPGTSSVELFNGKVTASTDFTLTHFTLEFTKSGGTAPLASGFTSVIAYINGSDYELDMTNAATTAWTFNPNVDTYGTPITIRVVGNVASSAVTGADYQITFTSTTGKNDDNVYIPANINIIGHVTTVNNGGYTLTRQSDTPTNKTITEGLAQNVLYFNLRANAEDQILTELAITAKTGSAITTGIDEAVIKLELMKGNSVVATLSNTNDFSGNKATFKDLSETLTKDTDSYYTVRATLKGGEVVNLGKTLKFTLDPANIHIARAANTSVATNTTSPALNGTEYYIASSIPTINITDKEGVNSTIVFTNTSSYYVELSGVKLSVTRNQGNNGFVAWSGVLSLLNGIEGDAVATSGAVPGEVVLSFNDLGKNLDSSSTYVANLLDTANTITADDYTITVKALEYKYVDKTDNAKSGAMITETYPNATSPLANVSK